MDSPQMPRNVHFMYGFETRSKDLQERLRVADLTIPNDTRRVYITLNHQDREAEIIYTNIAGARLVGSGDYKYATAYSLKQIFAQALGVDDLLSTERK